MNLTKTRWRILKLLAENNKTQTELADSLNISMPSVYSQLKYLEEHKLVYREKERKGKTRPFTEYSLGRGFVYFIEAVPNEAKKVYLEVDENIKRHLRIWSVPQKEFHYPIEKFWWDAENYIDDIEFIAVYGSIAKGNAREDSDIDVLIIVKKISLN